MISLSFVLMNNRVEEEEVEPPKKISNKNEIVDDWVLETMVFSSK